MAIAKVIYHFNAPIESVFNIISDHENYKAIEGITSSSLIIPGKEHKNGEGAIRDLSCFGTRFIEDITLFDPPHQFQYRVRECYFTLGNNVLLLRFPIIHKEGKIVLRATSTGTEVIWSSQFSADMPFGETISKTMVRQIKKAFTNVLEGMEKQLSLKKLQQPAPPLTFQQFQPAQNHQKPY